MTTIETKVVPVEPTRAMLSAAVKRIGGGSTFDREDRIEIARGVYGACLAAAPASSSADLGVLEAGNVSDPDAAFWGDVGAVLRRKSAAIAAREAQAADPAPVSEAVGVKPLVWEEVSDRCWDADGLGKLYRVLKRSEETATLKTGVYDRGDDFPSKAAAVAAAQADFEARVRSCLVSAPIAEADVLRAALVEARETLGEHQGDSRVTHALDTIDAALNAERWP